MLHHFRSAEDFRQGCFRLLFPFSQCIVQKLDEVGFDDLELARRHRDRGGKIIDHDCAGFNARRRAMTNQRCQARFPTLSVGSAGRT